MVKARFKTEHPRSDHVLPRAYLEAVYFIPLGDALIQWCRSKVGKEFVTVGVIQLCRAYIKHGKHL